MSDTGNSATRQLAVLGGRGWRWAQGSVAALVNDLASARADATAWAAMAFISADGIRLVANRKGQMVVMPEVAGTAAEAAARASARLTPAERQSLVLRIAPDRAILQDITLPRSAEPVLPAIIRNKIEGLSPWPPEDTVWGYAARASGAGGLQVTIGVLGRKALAGHLSALTSHGITPMQVDIAAAPDSATPVIIDHNSGSRAARVGLLLKAGVGLCAAAIVGAGLVGSYLAFHDHGELARVTARTEQLKRELTARPGTGAGGGKTGEAGQLIDRKSMERPFVAVLNDLTTAIPDGSWLTGLDMAEGVVTVQGRGGPAPGVLQSIEQAEAFSGANFASGTQRDDASGQDVFSISAAVEPQAVPQ